MSATVYYVDVYDSEPQPHIPTAPVLFRGFSRQLSTLAHKGCGRRKPPPEANTAWVYFECLISLSIILLFFSSYISFCANMMVVFGASNAVCCCVSWNGWIVYMSLESCALVLFVVDIVVNRNASSIVGIVIGVLGLILAQRTIKLMCPASSAVVISTPQEEQPQLVYAYAQPVEPQPQPVHVIVCND